MGSSSGDGTERAGSTTSPARESGGWSRAEPARDGSGPDELDVEVELDLLRDEHAAALEGHVPLEAPVLAVDLALGGEAGAGAAPRVAADAVELELELDRDRGALDREIAEELVVVPV